MASRNYSFSSGAAATEPPIPIRPARGIVEGALLAGSPAPLTLLTRGRGTIAAIFVVRSARFHDYVLRTVDTKASAALNTPVHLQNFALRLSTLSLDLYGLTVEGAGTGSEPAAAAGGSRISPM